VESSDGAWNTDDTLDTSEAERRLLRDDDPRYLIDVDDIADARLVGMAVVHAIFVVAPPQNEFVRRHVPVTPALDNGRGVPAEDVLSICLAAASA
jgi:hypothetical protein